MTDKKPPHISSQISSQISSSLYPQLSFNQHLDSYLDPLNDLFFSNIDNFDLISAPSLFPNVDLQFDPSGSFLVDPFLEHPSLNPIIPSSTPTATNSPSSSTITTQTASDPFIDPVSLLNYSSTPSSASDYSCVVSEKKKSSETLLEDPLYSRDSPLFAPYKSQKKVVDHQTLEKFVDPFRSHLLQNSNLLVDPFHFPSSSNTNPSSTPTCPSSSLHRSEDLHPFRENAKSFFANDSKSNFSLLSSDLSAAFPSTSAVHSADFWKHFQKYKPNQPQPLSSPSIPQTSTSDSTANCTISDSSCQLFSPFPSLISPLETFQKSLFSASSASSSSFHDPRRNKPLISNPNVVLDDFTEDKKKLDKKKNLEGLDAETIALIERRERNSAASARFRKRKKLEQEQLSAAADALFQRISLLQEKTETLEAEKKYLQGLIDMARRNQKKRSTFSSAPSTIT
eukprot:Sdes_comp19861_c0_seq1m12121